MKTITIALACLLYSVSSLAQITINRTDKPTSQIFNIESSFNKSDVILRKNTENFTYLPDSVIRTGLFGGVDIIRFKKIFTHDFNGNELETIEFVESYMNDVWDSLYKNTTIYSSFNMPTQRISYNYDDNVQEWLKESKRDYSYNNMNEITDLIISSWNNSTQSWHASNKIEYFYVNNNLDIKYTWVWDSDIEDWKPYFRQEYFYSNNALATTINKSWNEANQEWRLSHKADYFYDSNSDLFLINYLEWDASNQEWILQYDLEFFYNASGQLYKKIRGGYQTQKNDYSYYSHGNLKQEDISDWNPTTSNWDWHDKYVWYYTLQEVAEFAENGIKTLSVFPNPTNNKIQFLNLSDKQVHLVTFFNLQGAKLFTKSLENGSIELNTLAAGIYLYKIESKYFFQTGKIIKR